MLKRKYGNTGIELSILGFGGIIVKDEYQADANRFVAEAFDKGINYFDVAPSYGNSEDKLGPALEGKRNKIILACKTEKRTAKEAGESLNQSLKRLKTEYFDIFQLHAMSKMEEVETVFGPNGAMDVLIKAKAAGKIRYIGFSAHSEEVAIALLNQYTFQSVLFPFNWAAMLKEGFGNKLLKAAADKGAARLALKAMARANWPEGIKTEERKYGKCWYEPIDDEEWAQLALRFTLSQPVTAAIPPGDIRLFRVALQAVSDFRPISTEETEILRAKDPEKNPIFHGLK